MGKNIHFCNIILSVLLVLIFQYQSQYSVKNNFHKKFLFFQIQIQSLEVGEKIEKLHNKTWNYQRYFI